MDKDYLAVGDTVQDSPVGAGTVTGITARNYPQVNYVAVAWLYRTDGVLYDPHKKFKDGIYEISTAKTSGSPAQ
jgi:hypothetical protein